MTPAPVCPGADARPPTSSPVVTQARKSVAYALRARNLPISREAIEDLTQETLLRFWQRYPALWRDGHRGLLAKVARSVVLDAFRRELAGKRDARRTVALESLQRVPISPTILQGLHAREVLASVLAACRRALSGEDFRCFTLIAIEGLTAREAAPLLEIAPSSVNTRWHRLRQKLADLGLEVHRGGT